MELIWVEHGEELGKELKELYQGQGWVGIKELGLGVYGWL